MSATAPWPANTGTSALSIAAMSGKLPVAAACTSLAWKSAKPIAVRLIFTFACPASYFEISDLTAPSACGE